MSQEPDVKYPDITVNLIGQDGNALVLIGIVTRSLRENNVPREQIQEFTQECYKGDYNHVLQTIMAWVNVE